MFAGQTIKANNFSRPPAAEFCSNKCLTHDGNFRKVTAHSMWNRGTVGNYIESHRAKGSHPDRRVFIPQTRRLPSITQISRRLLRFKGSTDAETAPYTTVRGIIPVGTTTQQSGQSDVKKATAVKATAAADDDTETLKHLQI